MANIERPSGASRTIVWPDAGRLAAAPGSDERFPEIDGTSPEIESLKCHMRRVARDPFITVLLQGESGTGKERVAAAIHRASPRHRAPFVVVNCAGLSPTLVEDELFGHVRGAFTGAIADQPGPFERASQGTVFLDEIGELTPELQVKLLRALQQRAVQRLGRTYETEFDVRVIAATNVDLVEAVARGRFREDLYYRLKVYELRVPPLHRRGAADINALIATTLKRLLGQRRRPPVTLEPCLVDALTRHRWPGNVRELENVLERMIVAAESDRILRLQHLPDDFGLMNTGRNAPPWVAAPRVPLPSRAQAQSMLERNGFNRARTAAQLQLSRHQLYRLLKQPDASSSSLAS